MKRTVDFLNISSFMVEVERVKDPCLKGRPTVIAAINSDRSKVWDASSEAKEIGIHKGMDLAVAKRMERSLQIAEPRPDLYNSIQKKLLYVASRLTPVYESSALGKIYLDFSGFEKLYGTPQNFARKIQNNIIEGFQLRPRLGIAENKLIAKAATNPYQISEEVFQVNTSSKQSFLDPFPNQVLPVIKELKKSSSYMEVFEDLNLLTVQDLKGLDPITLEAIFPEKSRLIFQMARGIDDRPVIPPKNEPTVIVQAHLEEETNSLERLREVVASLADQSFAKLRSKGFLCKKFKLALRYADYKYLEKVCAIESSTEYAHQISAQLERSLGFLYTRRTSVRYVMLELMDLGKQQIQLSLLEDPKKPLMNTLDSINKKFPRKIKFGRELI
ncbi:MAG: hypothetical protein KC478_15400 [Bacteriovoracaceae bacterium]|nr:hypothetical protein [Bacteriovoracaceae bacterium]